ncbi:class I SAM-dependent methyltransferase [Cryptosporangium phraense]|uniref:Class I SAM-dependent methyltransferase n=1 Tax=Cryptosporangium phraense TaxID=2593070 RepID=A0A545ARV4_9ACTN|nr:class I SAM-dependent methyltransferase [Cryptosporangium phraense]TQS44066.1 class I SAM-dependent methyltransferase [Cryptosporangium phraense]
MSPRTADGSAGDADYGRIGGAYSTYRRPDPRIAAAIEHALGPARTVLNVGAGAGSYEPAGRSVTPVEPSASMRAQRPPTLAPAIDAVAEHLPFADDAFDAAMTTFSVHQWSDPAAGLRELRRVTRGPVAVLTSDPALLDRFWLADYAPEVIRTEARRYPPIDTFRSVLGDVEVVPVPIPLDCTDGFNEAYYGRPEMLLDPLARSSCSAWGFVDDVTAGGYVARLTSALEEGTWDRDLGHLRTQPTFEGSLVLVLSPA